MVGSQQELSCGSISTVTTEQEPVGVGFPDGPHSIQIPHAPHEGPVTYEAILSEHPEQIAVLTRFRLPRSLRGLVWHQSASGSTPPEDVADGSTSQTHVTSNSALLHALTDKCKHFMPNTYRGWTGHYLEQSMRIEKNMQFLIRSCTVRRQIWGNEHLSSRLGLL